MRQAYTASNERMIVNNLGKVWKEFIKQNRIIFLTASQVPKQFLRQYVLQMYMKRNTFIYVYIFVVQAKT
jgi:hypothetical protein